MKDDIDDVDNADVGDRSRLFAFVHIRRPAARSASRISGVAPAASRIASGAGSVASGGSTDWDEEMDDDDDGSEGGGGGGVHSTDTDDDDNDDDEAAGGCVCDVGSEDGRRGEWSATAEADDGGSAGAGGDSEELAATFGTVPLLVRVAALRCSSWRRSNSSSIATTSGGTGGCWGEVLECFCNMS